MKSLIATLLKPAGPGFGPLWVRIVFWVVAAFYAYGALVHLLNMASLTGFSWVEAPAKWQVLDIAYLVLDLIVAIGLIWGARLAIAAFFCAAFSQIALYTVFRSWVLDVPETFQRTAKEIAYLDTLVAFHLVTCLIIGLASFAWFKHRTRQAS